MEHVSLSVGKDWKRLARKLNINESCIDEIERKDNSVSENCYQALILWKKQRGRLASKKWLVKGLEAIGQNAIAEQIEDMDEAKEPGAYITD